MPEHHRYVTKEAREDLGPNLDQYLIEDFRRYCAEHGWTLLTKPLIRWHKLTENQVDAQFLMYYKSRDLYPLRPGDWLVKVAAEAVQEEE